MIKNILTIIIVTWTISGFSQDSTINNEKKTAIFVGYDFGEMGFNKFQNFAGEIGYKFKNDHTIRFTYMNVKLTEQHLSSNFAGAVDGDNVKGLWHGYELLYDIPIYRFKRRNSFFYGGLSAGYHENSYQHIILNESVEHKTGTVGFDLGYRETNIFKIKGLYINFQIPFRYNFKTLEETNLGDTTINKKVFEQSISFFVGYEF